jgi:hypothetical protein
MNQLPPPGVLDLTGNLAANFKRFMQAYEIYIIATDIAWNPAKVRANVLLHLAAPQALEIHNGFMWNDNEDKDNPHQI